MILIQLISKRIIRIDDKIIGRVAETIIIQHRNQKQNGEEKNGTYNNKK